MNTKITTFEFQPYEHKALEEYLEKMSLKGWKLQSMYGYILKFKKTSKVALKYSVIALDEITIFDGENSHTSKDFKVYCESAGWTLVTSHYKFQIYCCENPSDVIPIETCEDLKFKSIMKASIKTLLPQVLVIAILLFTQLLNFYKYLNPYFFSSNISLISMLLILFLGVYRTCDIISLLRFYFKGKKSLSLGERVEYTPLKVTNIKRYIFLSLISIAGLLTLYTALSEKVGRDYLFALVPYLMFFGLISKFISKRDYSKRLKRGLMVGNYILSVLLLFLLFGYAVSNNLFNSPHHESNITPLITHEDFNIAENKEEENTDYFNSSKSLLGTYNFYSSQELSYEEFHSNFKFINRYYVNRTLKLDDEFKKDYPDRLLVKIDTPNFNNFTTLYNNDNTYLFFNEDRVVELTIYDEKVPLEKILEIVNEKFFIFKKSTTSGRAFLKRILHLQA